MTPDKFYQELEASFPFAPTESQREWFPEITDFIFSKEKNIAFLLTGYAGTGKTTLIGSLHPPTHPLKLPVVNDSAVMYPWFWVSMARNRFDKP